METKEGARPTAHEEIRTLLPWAANGTLDEVEALRVEQHVAGCAACRDELAGERRLAEELRAAAPVAPAPHPVQLARLWARIEDGANDAASAAEPAGVSRRRDRTRLLGWLALAQAAAILVLAAVALAPRTESESRASESSATFHTLADSLPSPTTVQRLRVVFADDLEQRELREILLPLGAEIVAGPSPLGVYTLALKGEAEPLDWVVAHLRSLPGVRFAEPVRAEP